MRCVGQTRDSSLARSTGLSAAWDVAGRQLFAIAETTRRPRRRRSCSLCQTGALIILFRSFEASRLSIAVLTGTDRNRSSQLWAQTVSIMITQAVRLVRVRTNHVLSWG